MASPFKKGDRVVFGTANQKRVGEVVAVISETTIQIREVAGARALWNVPVKLVETETPSPVKKGDKAEFTDPREKVVIRGVVKSVNLDNRTVKLYEPESFDTYTVPFSMIRLAK